MAGNVITVTGCRDCPFLYSESEYENYVCNVPGSKVGIHRVQDRYSTVGQYKLEVWQGKCPLLIGPVSVRRV